MRGPRDGRRRHVPPGWRAADRLDRRDRARDRPVEADLRGAAQAPAGALHRGPRSAGEPRQRAPGGRALAGDAPARAPRGHAEALPREVILLARHGETDDNVPPPRVQGWIDTPLNDAGRGQARELADAVRDRGLAAIHSSHLARARETAEIVAGELG